MDANTPESFFRQIPAITKFLVVAIFAVTLLTTLGALNVQLLILDGVLIMRKWHFWRLITDYFFVGPFSISWIFHMYFFVSFSSKLEAHPCFSPRVEGRGAYLYFLILQMLALDLLSLAIYAPRGKPVLASSLSFAIIYYWSKKEPFATVGLWGFNLAAWQAPYALLVLDVLMGQSIWDDLMDIATAHFFHFVRDVLPYTQGINLLKRPPALLDVLAEKLDFMSRSVNRPPSGNAPVGPVRPSGGFGTLFRSAAAPGTAEFPGRGHRLGGNAREATD